MHRSHWAVRVLAATGVAALVGTGAPAAHAATEYDGRATALQVNDLRLDLLPGVPELNQAPDVVVPDSVVGATEYDGTDTVAETPPELAPLLTAELLEASSTRNDAGSVVSAASVSNLNIAEGVLTADLVRTTCTGDGDAITLDVSQAALQTDSPIAGEISISPGQSVQVPGVGSVTFNVQSTDGSSRGSARNLVIDLDTDLSAAQLEKIPAAADDVRAVLVEALQDVDDSTDNSLDALVSGLAQAGEDVPVEQLEGPLADLPLEQVDANAVAHLSGTVTVSAAQCSQAVVTGEPPAPKPEPQAPVAPVADRAPPSEPPLADTGSPAVMLGAGLTGLAALVGGGWTLLRTRRR